MRQMVQKLTTFPTLIHTTSNNSSVTLSREIPIDTIKNDELLITITGLAGSGKSTMAELIRELIDLYGVEVDDRTEIAQRQKYGSYDTDRQSKMERVCAVMNRLKRVVIIEESGKKSFMR